MQAAASGGGAELRTPADALRASKGKFLGWVVDGVRPNGLGLQQQQHGATRPAPVHPGDVDMAAVVNKTRLFKWLDPADRDKLTGYLRGYDQFMNLVIDETVEQVGPVPSAPRSHASAERARNGYSGSLRPPALWPGPMRSCALPVAVPSAHQCPGCGQQEQTRKRLREGEPGAWTLDRPGIGSSRLLW